MRRYGNGPDTGGRLGPDEAEEIAARLTEDELEGGRLETICVKWIADEARTLSEAVAHLRDFADWLAELESDGWQLVEPIDGGHGHLVNRDPRMRTREGSAPYRVGGDGSGMKPRACARCGVPALVD